MRHSHASERSERTTVATMPSSHRPSARSTALASQPSRSPKKTRVAIQSATAKCGSTVLVTLPVRVRGAALRMTGALYTLRASIGNHCVRLLLRHGEPKLRAVADPGSPAEASREIWRARKRWLRVIHCRMAVSLPNARVSIASGAARAGTLCHAWRRDHVASTTASITRLRSSC